MYGLFSHIAEFDLDPTEVTWCELEPMSIHTPPPSGRGKKRAVKVLQGGKHKE